MAGQAPDDVPEAARWVKEDGKKVPRVYYYTNGPDGKKYSKDTAWLDNGTPTERDEFPLNQAVLIDLEFQDLELQVAR